MSHALEATTVVVTTIGEHRAAPRLWLEGRKLADAGFVPGARYQVITESEGLVVRLVLSVDGERRVSARKAIVPIVDIQGGGLPSGLRRIGLRLRVVLHKGCVLITQAFRVRRAQQRLHAFTARLRAGEPLTMASLFHGGGVMCSALHTGLAAAGVPAVTRVAVELEAAYLESSRRNNAAVFDDQTVFIEGGVQDVDLARAPTVDVLECGIPCTGASLAGRAKRHLACAEAHASAGYLFFFTLQWIERLNPAVVILENVRQYQSTASMTVIRSTLQYLGYVVQERVMGGCAFGALEDRERLVVVAMTEGLADAGFDLASVQRIREKPERLADVLDDLPDDHPAWRAFDYLEAKEVRDRAAGKGFRRQLFTGAEARIATVTRDYAKCRSTDPFIQHPTDATLSRLLTVAEHARVKGVPLHLVEGLPVSRAHQVLGQGVIYPLFEALGRALGHAWVSWIQAQARACGQAPDVLSLSA